MCGSVVKLNIVLFSSSWLSVRFSMLSWLNNASWVNVFSQLSMISLYYALFGHVCIVNVAACCGKDVEVNSNVFKLKRWYLNYEYMARVDEEREEDEAENRGVMLFGAV